MIKQTRAWTDGTLKDDDPVKFTYSYAGNGLWVDGGGGKYQLARGTLLRNTTGVGIVNGSATEGIIRHVFERVQ